MKFFTSLLLPFVSSAVFEQNVQVPLVNTDTTTANAAPGIGIHFTTSYAVPTVRYSNGTFQQLPRIYGDTKYIESMIWWADPESPEFVDPNQGILAREALAAMLSRVQTVVEKELNGPINNAHAVFPVSQGLKRGDIEEAFELAGLTFLGSKNELPFLETNAAYAGLEMETKKLEHVLFLNFDNGSFGAVYHPMLVAAMEWQSPMAYILDTYLGWWDLPVDDIPRAAFWSDVKDVIKDVVKPIGIKPSKIVILGDHAANEELHDVVRASLLEVLEPAVVASLLAETSQADGLSPAAKGAAEWAFKIQSMMNHLSGRTKHTGEEKRRTEHKSEEKGRMEL